MTKPKRSTYARSRRLEVTLSEEARKELAELAWPDHEPSAVEPRLMSEMCDRVERILHFAVSMTRAERGPTPASQRRSLGEVERLARALERALIELHQDPWNLLELEFNDDWVLPDSPDPGAPLYRSEEEELEDSIASLEVSDQDQRDDPRADDKLGGLVAEVAKLAGSAEQCCEELASRKSRGQRRPMYRRFALPLLVEVFHDLGHIPFTDYLGSAQDFAAAALEMAGLSAPEPVEKFYALVPKRLHQPRKSTAKPPVREPSPARRSTRR